MSPTRSNRRPESRSDQEIQLLQEVLEENLYVSNLELAEIYLLRLRQEGLSGDRSLSTIAAVFAQEKVTWQQRQGGSANRSRRTSEEPPSLDDLLLVQQWAAQAGGTDRLWAEVQEVETMAARVGGLERLKASLRALERLQGKPLAEANV